jgi:phosphatidylinositol glycan class T
MPYNVIILSSTVIALAFGSVFNLLVRRFVALEEGDVVVGNKVRGLILRVVGLVRAKLEKVRETGVKVEENGVAKRGDKEVDE